MFLGTDGYVRGSTSLGVMRGAGGSGRNGAVCDEGVCDRALWRELARRMRALNGQSTLSASSANEVRATVFPPARAPVWYGKKRCGAFAHRSVSIKKRAVRYPSVSIAPRFDSALGT